MSAAFVTGTAANLDALFQVIESVLTANGWTSYDVISNTSGNRNVVFHSTPLDATANNRCYLQLYAVGSNFGYVVSTDWDVATNVSSKAAGAISQFTLSNTIFQYWIRVNEFAIGIGLKLGSGYYKGYAGFVRRCAPASKGGITRTSASYAAGASSMSVASDMTGKLTPGQKVVIYNHSNSSASSNYNNAELLTIQSVSSGTLTFTSPTKYGYDTNAVIGWNPHPAIVTYLTTGATLDTTAAYATMFNDGYWASNVNNNVAVTNVLPIGAEGASDPDDVSIEYLAGVIAATHTIANRTGFKGHLYHFNSTSGTAQLTGQSFTDGVDTFVLLYATTTICIGLGPV